MKFRLFVFSLLLLFPSLALPQSVGTAYLSSQINWSQTSDLYFTVVGGPPNTCGNFLSTRNGFSGYNSGSVCTDGSGNVTRGPWSWANTAADQTDTNIRIQWPNGTTTNFTTDHVWDKTCPSIQIDPSITTPPTNLSGSASDNQYGAGFDDGWTAVKATFWDETMDRFWNPATGAYDSVSIILVSANVSTMPSHNITWSFPQIPSSHTSGHRYSWVVDLYDGDNRCSPAASQAALFDYP
jgi:hypothetical protein